MAVAEVEGEVRREVGGVEAEVLMEAEAEVTRTIVPLGAEVMLEVVGLVVEADLAVDEVVQAGEEASKISCQCRYCSLEPGNCHLLIVNLAALWKSNVHEQYIYSSSLFV